MTDFEIISDKKELEETTTFAPRFGKDGLITAVTCDHKSGKVLMVGHMNANALQKTLASGKVHYWSRSRQTLWLKGETSGNVQELIEMLTDCDQDALVLRVRVTGDAATCHTGRESCFYRRVVTKDGISELEDDGAPRLFDPKTTY